MLAAAAVFLLLSLPAAAAPRVIASVVPVHAIVAAVMGGNGTPELLLEGQMSEHRATFTASQIAALGKADLVFIIGHGLEAKLAQLSGSEAVNGKSFTELSEAAGVATLPIREGGAWATHNHDADDDASHEHADGVLRFDPHVWLDPDNAKAMARAVADALSAADPGNAASYQSNARDFASGLDRLSAEIADQLALVKHRPFAVFHDAFQYFEHRFGLNAVGSITDVAASSPSAERLKELRDQVTATGAVCVFREPQYDARAVDAVIEGTGARSAMLDPLGAGLPPGPDAYPQLLRALAAALRDCLAG
ncbi:MAG: zinc ABC transporter substrate-binding protein [Alphaproteobacteria bacterium]|nr:zinc ABC transporter substrate-binding protein [Alphaproteobacteria bacterium]